MNIGKKILALGFSVVVLMSSTSVFAGTIGAVKYTGTSVESGRASLGTGTHYLEADSSAGKGSGNGTAYAMKVVPYFFDSYVGQPISITAPNGPNTAQFQAASHNSSGTPQSYYIRWNGSNSTASSTISIRH